MFRIFALVCFGLVNVAANVELSLDDLEQVRLHVNPVYTAV